jgi:ectoine hydroxylase-related dioxygenase (phytanoyl-CoA dioxygenase family)
MRELTHVQPDADLDDVVEILDRDGAVIVERFAEAATLDGLWADLGPELNASGYSESGYDGHQTKRLSSLFRRTTHMPAIVPQPLYLGAARRLLQQPSHMWVGKARIEVTPTIQLSATQAIRIDPGQGRQPLHRDDSLHLRRHPGRPSRLQLMLAMSELTAANGATLVIAGSHHWGRRAGAHVRRGGPVRHARRVRAALAGRGVPRWWGQHHGHVPAQPHRLARPG